MSVGAQWRGVIGLDFREQLDFFNGLIEEMYKKVYAVVYLKTKVAAVLSKGCHPP